MNKLISGFKGFIIGAVNVVPGISSGTLMVVFNIYDRFVEAANLFFKQPIKAILSVLDIAIGFLLGLVGSFLLISYTYKSFPLAITLMILGLVFGGYKPIFDKIKGKQKLIYLVVLVISLLIVVAMPLVTHREGVHTGVTYYIILVILGFIVAFAAIAPGISGSLVLLILGYYYHILDIGREAFELLIKGEVRNSLPYLLPIFVMAIAVIIGTVFSIKIIKKIMDKFSIGFYFSVMGMLIGSPIAILIILNQEYKIADFGPLQWIVGAILLVASFFLIFFMAKFENKLDVEETEKL